MFKLTNYTNEKGVRCFGLVYVPPPPPKDDKLDTSTKS